LKFFFNFIFILKIVELIFLIFLLRLVLVLSYLIKDKILNKNSFYFIYLTNFFFYLRRNIILFFIFFELSIIPILIIIGSAGSQPEKVKARNYLMFYSIFFSIPFLFIIILFKLQFIKIILKTKINFILYSYIILIFIIKIPIFFLHFWLPKVHVEASTIGSIILAGLLLKLGGIGFSFNLKALRKIFLLKLFFIPFLGLLFGNLITITQRDIKSFLAFSSIIHINFIIFNFYILIKIRKFRSFIIIISHGFISTTLFYLVGKIYKLNMRRFLYFFKGIFFNNYKILFFWISFILFNLGLPFNYSFFSELIGFLRLLNYSSLFLIIIFIYFLYSFIFVLFILINIYLGKTKKILQEKNNLFLNILLLLRLNYFIILSL